MRDDNPHAHCTDGPPDEDAYRRGFQQGAEAVLRALEGGVSRPRLEPPRVTRKTYAEGT